MSNVSMRARPARTASVSLDEWIEDATWHRRMYRQSVTRWTMEHVFRAATRFTHGRVSFETPAHLVQLTDQVLELREYRAQIRDAMAPKIRDLRRAAASRPETLALGLELMGLDGREAAMIERSAMFSTDPVTPNRDVLRTLARYMFSNPITDVWELRQVEAMYDAAEQLLEDARCDLLEELGERLGWDVTATFLRGGLTGEMLVDQVRWHRQSEKAPLDQAYPPVPQVVLADDF